MMSVDAIRLPAMVAHSFLGEGLRKLRANRQHLTKVAEYLSDGRRARGWDPRFSTSAVARAVVESRRSATLHDHPLTPEV